MSEESKPEKSAIEESAQIHEGVAEDAVKDAIGIIIPGASSESKPETENAGDKQEKKD